MFNEKVTVTVDAALTEELKAITKIQFEAFALLPDGKKDSVAKAEGHVKDGKAAKEITLLIPNYKTPEGKPFAVKVEADTTLADNKETTLKRSISHRVVAEAKVKAKGGKFE